MGGTTSAIAQLNISNNAKSDISEIGVIISGNYQSGVTDNISSEVTVIKPKPDGVIAGGTQLCCDNSTGFVKGSEKYALNFDVEYALKGTVVSNPKGKVTLNVTSFNKPDGTIDNVAHYYTIRSNALASLNITSPTATFSGKTNIAETNPTTGVSTSLEGNCQMVLELKDGLATSPTSIDLVGITIQRNGGGLWYSNNWVSTKTVMTAICGEGDISVTRAPTDSLNKAAFIIEEIAPVVPVEPTLRAYPNPFTERLNIEFSSATDTQAKLEIYSITGAKLTNLFDAQVNGGELYKVEYVPNLVSSQMVFYHLTMNGKTQVGKVVYQEK